MLLAGLASARPQRIDIIKGISINTGDRVVIGIDEVALLQAALVVYGLPLLLLFMGAAIGEFGFSAGEPVTVLCCTLGLLIGILGSGWFSRCYSRKRLSSRLVLIDDC